jgi:hypothetical protein
MKKTNFVLESIKAIKGNRKAKKEKIEFYFNNSKRIEALTWDYLRSYNFESEIVNHTKNTKIAKKIVDGDYSAAYVKKLIGLN